MATWFGEVLKSMEVCWRNIRLFAFRNRTIFESIFILIYLVEQSLLVILAYLWPKHITLFIALFALMVLTTFALHKLLMESRIKILESKVRELEALELISREEAEVVNQRYNKIFEAYNKLVAKIRKFK